MSGAAHQKRLAHLPALDGLRGLAVIAVLLFHGGFRFARGGYLGVSVFFTLSGFLITNLLVAEWADRGTISLRTFWSRRFRRLMPAAIAALLLIALYGWTYASPEQLENLRGDLLAALGYLANWRFLMAKLSYADLFSAPSPVQHFWSLAIEEQFYVVYPLLVLGLLRAGGRRLLAVVLALAAGGSLIWALVERANLDRVYYGTDTRMLELLAGGLLALWWSALPAARERVTRRRAIGVAAVGFVGLAGTVAMWPTVEQTSPWLTRGVLPLQAVLSVLTIAASARPGILERMLGWQPLRTVGLVSYGLYLYHWPIFLVLSEERTGMGRGQLFVLRIAATVAAALVSYYWLEQPIRRRQMLLQPRIVRTAVLTGVVSVIVTALAVTWAPPQSKLAHANVSLDDQTITVERATSISTPSSGSGVAAPGAIMIIGDSGTYDAAPGIGAAFEHLGTSTVVDASFPGFGFTRNPDGWKPDYAKLVGEHRPGIVVIMLGGWDKQFVKDKGAAAYDRLLDEAVSILTARGGRIVWLGMLPDDKTETATMSARFRAAARRHADKVVYLDPGPLLRGPDGRYQRWLDGADGGVLLVRKPDGWHLCPDGSVLVARATLAVASRAGWSPPLTPGWEDGAWRTNARFDDPEGGCDPTREENQPPRQRQG